jgi:class 3 adenylate cyclase/tetratricopeptide (TPR) repeat protein
MEPRGPEPRETEQRRATVMFADLTGFTSLVEQAGDARAYVIVRECMTLLDGIARHYGASVDHHQGDAIMAVFGVPKAVEDAPRAAVNASIEMRRELARFNERQRLARPLDVHVGIETGPVISGETTGPLIREFHVVGDAVNTAARLKDMAPAGQIWVGGETWRATRDVFDFESMGALEVKGKRRQVRAFAVRSSRERVYRVRSGTRRPAFSELVGREEELTLLRAALGSLAAGRGRIVGIVGEPGIGKSRLVAEAMASSEGRRLSWLEGRCLSVGRNLRFHPFVDLFRSWFGLSGDEPDATALAGLAAALAEHAGEAATDEVTASLASLLGIPLPPEQQQRIELTRGDARERMLHQAVARVLTAAAARAPLVIAIDDLHWSDLSTLEMLEALLPLAVQQPLGFVLMFRPGHESTAERIRRYCRDALAPHYEEIPLAALDAADTRTLIENFFRGGELPRETREAIRERVAGNPFFAEEIVRSLLDEGAAEIREGGLVATERIHAFVIPGSVRDVLTARIDALERPRRQLLQLAAVMGDTFLAPVLEDVLEKSAAEELGALADANLIQPSAWGEGRWSFQHPLIQEVAYETIFEITRPELHRRVGESLERLLTRNAPGLQAMLAYHYGRAGDAARSEEYLFRAGTEAVRAAASNEALFFFRQAADVYVQLHGDRGDPDKRAQLEKHVGIAYFNRGQFPAAVERFDRALEALGDRTGAEGGRALWLRFALELLLVIPRLCRPPGKERMHPASDREREIIAVRSLRALAETLGPAFAFHTMSTLRLLLRLDPATVPNSGALMAGADGIFTFAGISPRLGRRVLALADARVAAGHVGEMRLYHAFMHFIHHFLVGDWSPEHTIDDALIEEGLRLGQLWEVGMSLDLDCEWSLARGDFARAERRIEQLREVADVYANQHTRVTAFSLGAFLAMEHDRLADAAAEIERYQDAVDTPGLLLVGHATRARILARQGRLEEAKGELEKARPLQRQAGRMMPFHESFPAVARFEVDVTSLGAAKHAAQRRALARSAKRSRARALALARKVAPRRPEVLRLAALHDAALGRHSRALASFENALAVASSLGARPEQARICADLARFLERDAPSATLGGRDAAAFRAEALRLRTEMGLPPESTAE